jgi:REP element-mobilizing transposase RayT
MGKLVGYMVTWTTYGTWLQGDRRKYVKDGEILPADKELEEANKRQQKSGTVRLTNKQKKIVEDVILKEGQRIGQEILALGVFSNHVHIVIGSTNESIENTVSRYKNAVTCALKKAGLTEKIWTRGFNKRFCFSNGELATKIEYVRRQQEQRLARRPACG